MEKNWLIINGYKLAVEATIQMETTSPFSDKTYVFFAGSKLPTRGENSYPFPVSLSAQDLAQMGFPHLLQNTTANNMRINNVLLYSNGIQRFNGSLILTNLRRNNNTGAVKAQALLFDPVTDFVNKINATQVNQLSMGGVRVIDDLNGDDHTPMNYYTQFLYPGGATPAVVPTQPFQGVNKLYIRSGPIYIWSFHITYPDDTNANSATISIQSNSSSTSPTDLCGTATADYAAIITLNGDPGADENGGMICFPPIAILDDQNGNSWLNYWDPTGGNYYPCVRSCPDSSSSVDLYAENVYEDMGNHIVPMYYYHQVIRHCFSDLGFKLIDDSGFLSDPHFKRLVLVNNFDILNTMTVNYTNSDGSNSRTVGYWQGRTLIDPKNHLPADTVQDFLLDFMVKFNCFFEFGENGLVYLRKGDFMTIDRELKEYAPEDTPEFTLDTGITLAYDFPADKQYDNIKKVQDMTSYEGFEKIFFAGFNKLYPVPMRDAIPSPLPEDDYYGILYEDCNQVAFSILDTPVADLTGASPWVYPYHFYIDNVLPVTLGIDTRPDSPSVNQQEAIQANTNSYTLKYPPVSHINDSIGTWTKQTPYKLNANTISAAATDRITVVGDSHYGSGSWQGWVVGNSINSNIGAGMIIPLGWSVEYHSVIPAYVNPGDLTGLFIARGVVTGYDNHTGWLTFLVSYVEPTTGLTGNDDLYFDSVGGVNSFGWNNWSVTLTDTLGYEVPISTPIMQVSPVIYPSQEYIIDHVTQTATSAPWVKDGATGVMMPSDWITRSETPIIEMGFYWSRPASPQGGEPDQGLVRMFTDALTYTGTGMYGLNAPLTAVHSLTGTALYIPLLTGYERVYGNPGIVPGWFNLGLHGPYGIPAQFWQGFINQYIFNRKVTITVYESMAETMQHKFWNSVLYRGTKLYVSQIRAEIPYRGKGVTYVCYLI